MNITISKLKELIKEELDLINEDELGETEEILLEAPEAGGAAAPEQSDQKKISDDISKILTPADMKAINTNREFIRAIEEIIGHADSIDRGRQILINLLKKLPKIIKKLK
jgi:hypothetical protein